MSLCAYVIVFFACPFAVSFVSSFEKLVCCSECAQHFMFPSIESAVLYAVSTERQVRIMSLVVFHASQRTTLLIYQVTVAVPTAKSP